VASGSILFVIEMYRIEVCKSMIHDGVFSELHYALLGWD
jgi:hypothetical protein